MNAQKKLDDAAATIRTLTITKDKQRQELARAAREIVELRLKLDVVKKLACDTAGDPVALLQKIAAMFEVKQ